MWQFLVLSFVQTLCVPHTWRKAPRAWLVASLRYNGLATLFRSYISSITSMFISQIKTKRRPTLDVLPSLSSFYSIPKPKDRNKWLPLMSSSPHSPRRTTFLHSTTGSLLMTSAVMKRKKNPQGEMMMMTTTTMGTMTVHWLHEFDGSANEDGGCGALRE